MRHSRCFGRDVSCNCGVAVREADVILVADMCNRSLGLTYVTYNAKNLPDDAGITVTPATGTFKVCRLGLLVVSG